MTGTALAQLDFALDRSSPVPLYYQLARQLESAIEHGALGPGSLLGNEIDLAGRLGLSRPTVRQAIQSLVEKGLLVRRRGVGTQVVHSQVRRPLELSSLYDDLEAAGQTAGSERDFASMSLEALVEHIVDTHHDFTLRELARLSPLLAKVRSKHERNHPELADVGFAFDRHRFNVATSRAQCRAVLVCSPRLLDADCKTVGQMRLVSAVCAFVERALASP